MEYRDYYASLGVPRGAPAPDIKKAYRKLARQHHPDVNKSDPAAEQRFKEISEAYAVLGDEEKRKAYDSLGANWEAYQNAGASGRAGNPFALHRFRLSTPGGGVRHEDTAAMPTTCPASRLLPHSSPAATAAERADGSARRHAPRVRTGARSRLFGDVSERVPGNGRGRVAASHHDV
jgi:curved DNA-binding protein CbpA